MSRNFIPAVLAIGMGILTSYYTFQPALQQLQAEKHKTQSSQPQSQDTQLKPPTSAPESSNPASAGQETK